MASITARPKVAVVAPARATTDNISALTHHHGEGDTSEDGAKHTSIALRLPATVAGLSKKSRLRRLCIELYFSEAFHRCILVAIVLNTIVLGVDTSSSMTADASSSTLTTVLAWLDVGFNAVFTLEVCVKMLAVGVLDGPQSYLQSRWNIVDLLLVLLGWLTILLATQSASQVPNLGLFRLLRILKVLRGITFSRGLQTLVQSLFEAMQLLVHVGHLMLVVLAIFAIAGINLFRGALHQQCDNEYVDGSGPRCGARPCPGNGACSVYALNTTTLYKDLNDGYTSFDHFGLALLTVIEVVSFSNWGQTLFALVEAKSGIAALYFVLLIPVGSYFVVNLVIAVIHDAYARKLKHIQRALVTAQLKLKKKSLAAKQTRRAPSVMDVIRFPTALPATTLSHMELHLLLSRFQDENGHVNYMAFATFFSQSSHVNETMNTLRRFLQRAKVAGLHTHSLFRFFDKDQNGRLSLAELQSGFQAIEARIGIAVDYATVVALHAYLDLDNSGHVDLAEFIRFADAPSRQMELLEQKVLLECHACEVHGTNLLELFRAEDDTLQGMVNVDGFKRVLRRMGFHGAGVHLPAGAASAPKAAASKADGTIKRVALAVMHHRAFALVINVALFVNVGVLLVRNPNDDVSPLIADPRVIQINNTTMSDTNDVVWMLALSRTTDVLACIFCLEMLVKINGLSLAGYAADTYNLLDGIVTVIGMLHLCFSSVASMPDSVARGFRIVRVARVFALGKQLLSFRMLLETMLTSFRGLCYYAILLGLVLYVFALIGMNLFGHSLPSFQTLWKALLTVFQIFTGDEWTSVLYSCMDSSTYNGVLFVISAFVAGFYISLNVFLSILLQNFDSDENAHHRSYFETLANAEFGFLTALWSWFLQRWQPPSPVVARELSASGSSRSSVMDAEAVLSAVRRGSRCADPTTMRLHEVADILFFQMDVRDICIEHKWYFACVLGSDVVDFLLKHGYASDVLDAEAIGSRLVTIERLRPHAASRGRYTAKGLSLTDVEVDVCTVMHELVSAVQGPFGNDDSVFSLHPRYGLQPLHPSIQRAKTAHERRAKRTTESRQERHRALMNGNALGCFPTTSSFRARIAWLTLHRAFGIIVLLSILLSCVLAAMEGSASGGDVYSALFFWGDAACTLLFTVEILLRVIAQGLWFTGPRAYLRDGWNVLDCAVTAFALVTLSVSLCASTNVGATHSVTKGFSAAKPLRAFRALRPLRIAHHNDGIKIVLSAILKTLPCVVHILGVVVVFVCIFALVAVELFAGKLAYCDSVDPLDRYTKGVNACLSDPDIQRAWVTPLNNYDTVGSAIVYLLQLTTLQGWSTAMHDVIDAPSMGFAGLPLVHDNTPSYALFFLVFVVVCGFFMMGLFLGVIVYKFDQIKAASEGTIFLTEEQKRWVSIQRQLFTKRPHYVPSNPHARKSFRYAAFACIQHWIFEVVTISAVGLNVVLMATDHFPSLPSYQATYDNLQWAFTAFFLLEASVKVMALGVRGYIRTRAHWLDLVVLCVSVSDSFIDVGVLRMLRVVRAYRLLKNSRGLLSLLHTLETCLPSLLNVGSLLVLVIFVYAILGMNLFGEIVEGECLRPGRNFESLSSAMLVLFVVVTGDRWDCYLGDMLPLYPQIGRVYIFSLLILGNYVVLNILIAVVLESFNEFMAGCDTELEDQPTNDHLDAFAAAWGELAHQGSLFLPSYKLAALLRMLPPPLGLPGHDRHINVVQFVRSLDVRRNAARDMFYLDIFYALCHRTMPNGATNFESAMIEKHLQTALAAHALRHFHELHSVQLALASLQRFDLTLEFNSALVIQKAWHKHRQQVTKENSCESSKTVRARRPIAH
ncbi:hypothetical protein SDRG_04028 [Saprolegnia diclina VS20]|uniref:EF-hand domain-containing protein n=1 Tax=Saprolegnia diclina (strain VS20) TaxID=1156394 RepID=T0S072_SAPDV|nr:hypothetical protein SDRG_04028 [Saprolegnia diclina VS20]EQC38308.1 hypothetical protein SDRG_04028 [Saprolegnia diclina VS20]|eukprot:XP_008607900.1 hypothetical protein SDRG_04028 [Saprolegnia diclina VS20]